MAYETFERTTTRSEKPMLSVLPDSRITFNAAASRLLKAKRIRAVKILWDKDRCGIAFPAVDKDDRNAYSIFFNRGRAATISPKSFLNYIGWSAKKSQTVPVKWNSERDMLEAELPFKFVSTYERNMEGH